MKRTPPDGDRPSILGWREWVRLPELGIPWIKAKLDTGARTSALHAFYLEPFREDGRGWIRFGLHPRQGSREAVYGVAPIRDRRWVTDSGGHGEYRFVIEAALDLGGDRRRVEMTLTNRDTMRFRMLLGRTALRGGYVVDPGRSFRLGGGPDHPMDSDA